MGSVGADRGVKKPAAPQTPFGKFCAAARDRPECRRLDLADFLIKPFQRITKYPLLLKDLLALTDEDHPDYEYIETAVQQLRDIIGAANERKRFGEGIMEVLEVQNELAYEASDARVNLAAVKERRVLQRATCQIVWADSTPVSGGCIVFTDLLLLTRARRKDGKMPYAGSEPRSGIASALAGVSTESLPPARAGDGLFPLPLAGAIAALAQATLLLRTADERARLLQAIVSPIPPAGSSSSGAIVSGGAGSSSATDGDERAVNHMTLRSRQCVAQWIPHVPNLGRYEVQFDFADGDSASLALRRGDVVVVYQKDPSAWWYVELYMTGRRGFCPRDYLRKFNQVQL